MEDSTIDGQLHFAQNAISNAQQVPELAGPLADKGYNATKMGEGAALLTNAKALHKKHKKEYGEQYAATKYQKIARALAKKEYMTHLSLARLNMETDPYACNALILLGDRKGSLSGLLDQMNTFYTNVLETPEFQSKLAEYNITVQDLTAAQALVKDFEAKTFLQSKETGEAQAATKTRDAAFDELSDWMRKFKVVARIAFEGNPQYLEMLGIVEPS